MRQGSASRKLVILVASAVAVAGAAAVTWKMTHGTPVAPARAADEEGPAGPPPDVAVPRTEEERIRLLVDLLLHGDTEDGMWARIALSRAGEPGRKLVAETAANLASSNLAFLEHALEFLLREPRPSDVPLAREALSSVDPDCRYRGLALLAVVADANAREAIPAIGAMAADAWPAPKWALEALVKLGGDAAVAELERIALSDAMPVGVADQALARLGNVGGDRAREILLREFAAAKTPDRVLAASEGLVTMGDATPVPRLRELLRNDRSEQAFTLLARAKDETAFREIESRVRGPVESSERRELALVLLANYPAAERLPILRHAAMAKNSREVRVEAWRQLVADGPQADRDDAIRLLHASGADARETQIVGALALAAWGDPSCGKALAEAEARAKDDEELRTILLRALVIVGNPETAEAVVRSMASDPLPHGRGITRSFEAAALFLRPSKEFRAAAGPWIAKALRGELGPVIANAKASLLLAAQSACGEEAAPAIEALLADPDHTVRQAAAAALVECGGPNSVAALRFAWWNPQDRYTRSEIARALSRIVLARPPVR